mgnify:CR=1 FL=1
MLRGTSNEGHPAEEVAIVVHDFESLVEQGQHCLRIIGKRSKEYVCAVHEFGLLLLPVETQYGDNTMGKLAARLNCSLTFLYRAKDFAEVFPTVALLDIDIAQKEAEGRPIYIRDYYLNGRRGRGEARRELVEAKIEEAMEAVERLKATTPEVPLEEVESLEVIAQETKWDLHAHVDEGAEDMYRGWLRQQPCLFCGYSPCDCAHLPQSRGAGGTILVPTCHQCHMEIHQRGFSKFLVNDPSRLDSWLRWTAAAALAVYSRRSLVL